MESRYSVIDLSALEHNFNVVKQKVALPHGGSRLIMAVVKANAYGHGLIECALYFEKLGTDYLGVALIEEAITLRAAGITKHILVLGALINDQIDLFLEHGIDIMASSIEKLKIINDAARSRGIKARVHLKIDTGLGRIGVRAATAEPFLLEAVRSKNIDIIGIASHFATADAQDTSFMREQYEKFCQTTYFFEKHALPMPLRHIANSGAIMNFPDSYLDMVRPGIMLYGIYPHSWMRSLCALKPAMSLYARVVYFKVLLESARISYGLTWKTLKNTRVITLPIGYGDGYPRALSNKGQVLLQGERYPIVGNICMDQMMVDIGTGQAYNGDEVVLIGSSGDQQITVNELAEAGDCSPYELLVQLNSRIARRYLETGRG